MKKYYLYSRDSKKKVRVFILTVTKTIDKEEYTLARESGLLNGKLVKQPELVISKGLAKRTVLEQAQLKASSLIKSQKDKGYVSLDQMQEKSDTKLDPMNYDSIDSLLDLEKTDASGNKKPMLAFDPNPIKEADKKNGTAKFKLLLSRAFWVSTKLDGVRTKGQLTKDANGNDKIDFLSRTGKPYEACAKAFNFDQELIQFMKDNDCEIDGEFYIHGVPLKDINGTCNTKTYDAERHDKVEFWIFDMAKEGMDASERCKILNKLVLINPKIKVVKHYYAVGYDEVMKLHDEWFAEGYEGAMVRTTEGMYEFGKRSKVLIKIKMFQDAEFEIVGISDGLRPEDMCFILKIEDGSTFKAKPLGDAEVKQEYIDSIDTLISKMGTVKFQYLTEDGIPFLPTFKCVRDDDN